MNEIGWHRRETRRTTENTNFDLRLRPGEIPEDLSGSPAPGTEKEKRPELERSPRFLGASTRSADNEPRQGTKSPGAILNSRRLARRVSHREVANRPGNGSKPKPTSCVDQVRLANPIEGRVKDRWEVRLAHSTPSTGKPCTWGRGQPWYVVHIGNICRA